LISRSAARAPHDFTARYALYMDDLPDIAGNFSRLQAGLLARRDLLVP
jgi:hypothetical protein